MENEREIGIIVLSGLRIIGALGFGLRDYRAWMGAYSEWGLWLGPTLKATRSAGIHAIQSFHVGNHQNFPILSPTVERAIER